jgi:hypothetical protein
LSFDARMQEQMRDALRTTTAAIRAAAVTRICDG